MDELRDEVKKNRDSEYDIDPLFLNRWSPRAMTGEMISEEEYMSLFEAARWAPSSFNNQHWRFLYATRSDEDKWEKFGSLVNEGNWKWAKNAAVLVCLVSKKTFDYNGEPARTHSFDTGAAWENLALEAARRNLVAHAMQGFDYEEAADSLDVPEEYEVECMIAIGRRASADVLPDDLQDSEYPNQRKTLDEICYNGGFNVSDS